MADEGPFPHPFPSTASYSRHHCYSPKLGKCSKNKKKNLPTAYLQFMVHMPILAFFLVAFSFFFSACEELEDGGETR